MQDFKNKNQEYQVDKDPFDVAIHKLLADAEMPAPDLMDKVFATLDKGQQEIQSPPTTSQSTGNLFKIKAVRIAAVAIILLGLAFAVKVILKTEPGAPNSDLLVGGVPQVDKAGHKDNLARLDAQKDNTVMGSQKEEPQKLAKNTTDPKLEQAASTPKKEFNKNNNASNGGAAKVVHLEQQLKQKALVSGAKNLQVSTTSIIEPSERQPEKLKSTLDSRVAQVEQSAVKDQVIADAPTKQGAKQGAAEMTQQKTAAIQKMPPVQIEPLVADGDEQLQKVAAQNRKSRRGRKRLLGNLLQSVRSSAREISEEVVRNEEDKTVISIGIVAITAYK